MWDPELMMLLVLCCVCCACFCLWCSLCSVLIVIVCPLSLSVLCVLPVCVWFYVLSMCLCVCFVCLCVVVCSCSGCHFCSGSRSPRDTSEAQQMSLSVYYVLLWWICQHNGHCGVFLFVFVDVGVYCRFFVVIHACFVVCMCVLCLIDCDVFLCVGVVLFVVNCVLVLYVSHVCNVCV